MELMFSFLFFCTIISFFNFVGLYPRIEYGLKNANNFQVFTMCIYIGLATIGYLHIIGWILFLYN